MKIAIPTFATRVSPRFDCAQSILMVTVERGESSKREELAASHWAPHERISRLLELGVDTVICGGIDRLSVAWLRSAGVTVYGWVTGETEDALRALLRGDLDAEAATESGGRCRCRRFLGDESARAGPPSPGQSMRGRRGYGGQRGGGRRRSSDGP